MALQNHVQVYSLSQRRLLHEYVTADNPGILCVSASHLAFPGPVAGQIQMVEIESGKVSMTLGHDAPLRILSFSQDSELLASASEKVRAPFPSPSTRLPSHHSVACLLMFFLPLP